MVHSYMKPPKKSRRDCLALLSPDVDLATVDGPASHPLFCRQKNKKIKKNHTGEAAKDTRCRFIKADRLSYSVSEGAINNQPDVLKHQRDQPLH